MRATRRPPSEDLSLGRTISPPNAILKHHTGHDSMVREAVDIYRSPRSVSLQAHLLNIGMFRDNCVISGVAPPSMQQTATPDQMMQVLNRFQARLPRRGGQTAESTILGRTAARAGR